MLRRLILGGLLVCAAPAVAADLLAAGKDFADMSLEELSSIVITSVNRRQEPLSDAAASVFVITSEDIKRHGARTLADTLRLAPNLQVAQIQTGQYAISARGFNNSVGNKLLVLIDGRTVYTPTYSGVFWDMQDVLLDDVERIEVISGPGATLWGANAVNGVINVITRSAHDTVGTEASVTHGSNGNELSARRGIQLENGAALRVYAKTADFQNTTLRGTGATVVDGRDLSSAGFRADWDAGIDAFTLQGDAYYGRSEDRGRIGAIVLGRTEVAGSNLLGRWSRQLGERSEFQLQAYVDQSKRQDPVLLQPDTTILDIEGQYGVKLGTHRVLLGGGHRQSRDTITRAILAGFDPTRRELKWTNVFVQDEWSLASNLTATLGLKLESNSYTGVEKLPSFRLAWKATPSTLLWTSLSRAVRAPARYDRDVYAPFLGTTAVGPNFKSEVANVVEVGARGQITPRLNYSVTVYHHEWDRLRSGTSLPLMLENKMGGRVYGLESWGAWQATGAWRLMAGLTTVRKSLALDPSSTDPVGVNNVTLANDPEYQWMLRSMMDIGDDQKFDATLRYVSRLPAPAIAAYSALDLRYAWQVSRELELSLVAQNLLDSKHAEFATSAAAPSEIDRALFLRARWTAQ